MHWKIGPLQCPRNLSKYIWNNIFIHRHRIWSIWTFLKIHFYFLTWHWVWTRHGHGGGWVLLYCNEYCNGPIRKNLLIHSWSNICCICRRDIIEGWLYQPNRSIQKAFANIEKVCSPPTFKQPWANKTPSWHLYLLKVNRWTFVLARGVSNSSSVLSATMSPMYMSIYTRYGAQQIKLQIKIYKSTATRTFWEASGMYVPTDWVGDLLLAIDAGRPSAPPPSTFWQMPLWCITEESTWHECTATEIYQIGHADSIVGTPSCRSLKRDTSMGRLCRQGVTWFEKVS